MILDIIDICLQKISLLYTTPFRQLVLKYRFVNLNGLKTMRSLNHDHQIYRCNHQFYSSHRGDLYFKKKIVNCGVFLRVMSIAKKNAIFPIFQHVGRCVVIIRNLLLVVCYVPCSQEQLPPIHQVIIKSPCCTLTCQLLHPVNFSRKVVFLNRC